MQNTSIINSNNPVITERLIIVINATSGGATEGISLGRTLGEVVGDRDGRELGIAEGNRDGV